MADVLSDIESLKLAYISADMSEASMRLANSNLIQITEDTIKSIVVRCGGALAHPVQDSDNQNADFLIDEMIIELKCLDVDLLHTHRDEVLQALREIILRKVDSAIKSLKPNMCEVHVCVEKAYRALDPEEQFEIDRAVITRAKKLAAKSADQIESSGSLLGLQNATRCMWVVNNNNLHVVGLDTFGQPDDILNGKIASAAFSKTRRLDLVVISKSVAYEDDFTKDVAVVWNIQALRRTEGRAFRVLSFEELQAAMPTMWRAHEQIVDYAMSDKNFIAREGEESYRPVSTSAWTKLLKECVFHYGYEDQWPDPEAPVALRPLRTPSR